MLSYGKQSINEADIKAVTDVLQSDYLTTGPKVEEFEDKLTFMVNVKHGVAVSSGTAALHCATQAINIKPGDEVLVPAITFVATANAVKYQGGTPVIVDVEENTLLIDIDDLKSKITDKTKAIISVDYAGQLCDYKALKAVCKEFNLFLIQDACHALGTLVYGDIACYSFHPVKHITTGEGGMAVTNNEILAHKIRQLRNHGRNLDGAIELGYNYRLSDVACAMGISQLDRLDSFIAKRKYIAAEYDRAFTTEKVKPLRQKQDNSYHLYVVKVKDQYKFIKHLEKNGIGTQIHYKPLTLQHLYLEQKGSCPVAEKVWRKIVSIPIYPDMTEKQINKVIHVVNDY